MNRFTAKEVEIDNARNKLEQLSTHVKRLTSEVKKGNGSKAALNGALDKLEEQSYTLKILTQESKILNGWQFGSTEKLPTSSSKLPWILSIILIIVLMR